MAILLRRDIEVSALYTRAKKEKEGKSRVRYLGLAALLEGKTREEAALIAGMSVSNLYVWIRRFNKHGLEGLVTTKRFGKKSSWTEEIQQFLREKALEGASFEENKRIAYRLEDFQKLLHGRFGILYGISTIWYALKRLELSWISARQKHPKTDSAAQEEFKKKSLMRLGIYKLNIQQKK